MIKKLLTFLEIEKPELESQEELTVPLATAVLFYEVMRADHVINPKEIEAFRTTVMKEMDVESGQVKEMLQKVEQKISESVDYMQFTRLIHENCSFEEKRKIIGLLWHLAAADGHIDPHEEHLIRKFSDLLYLSHSDFIQAKLGAIPH
ncbi:MAG: TerB family tellurite resistance protein [Aestuariibacter sp.]